MSAGDVPVIHWMRQQARPRRGPGGAIDGAVHLEVSTARRDLTANVSNI